MKENFQTGVNYYLKIDLTKPFFSDTNTADGESVLMNFKTGTKYRVDGGLWNTIASGYKLMITKGINTTTTIYSTDGIFVFTSLATSTGNSSIEFCGIYDGGGTLTYENQTQKYLRSIAIANPIEIELDKMNCEPHFVSKTTSTNLLYVDTAYGVFREEQNVLTPSIVIEYDNVPNFNYVYISSLSRYYFVTGITLVRYRVYRIDLKVDVLCTYDLDIRTQLAHISRNENTYDILLVDDRLPLENKYTQYNPTITDGTLKNITFSTSGIIENVVVVASSEKYSDSVSKTYDVFTRPNSLTDIVNPYLFTEKKIYAMVPHSEVPASPNTYEQALLGFFKASFNKSAIGDSVLNVVAFPFNVKDTGTYYGTYLSVSDSWIGYDGSIRSGSLAPKDTSSYDSDDSIKAYLMYDTMSKFLVISDFTFPYPQVNNASVENTRYQWLAYEPYSNYEIYIPYYGWVKVNSKDVLGKRIIIYYSVNYITGSSNVYIESITDNKIIFSATCQLGTLLSVSVSNKTELNNQKNANALNLILGLISSAVSIGAGAVSGNPIAIGGGAIAGTKTITETINKSSVLFERTQATLHDSNAGIYGIQKVLVRIYTKQPIQLIDSNYAHINGSPFNATISLTSITGYTEIPEMHYVPSTYKFITKTEIDEIISLAKNGIIL